MTNFVSAYWHGFYIGFYVFFGGLFLNDLLWKMWGQTALAATVSESVPSVILRVFNWWACGTLILFWGISYCLYELGPTMRLWENWYYIPHIVSFGGLLIAAILPKRKRDKKVEDTGAKAG